jgi:hypothetical protein
MDAVKFIEERKRMCNGRPCAGCPLFAVHQLEHLPDCKKWCMDHPEASVTVVEKWAEEHPCKTRQSEFLKQYPEASISKHGVLLVCPCPISASHRDAYGGCATIHRRCDDCRKEYWLQEVE